MKQLKIIILFIVSFTYMGSAQAVQVNGKDWRQLTETTNISYNDMLNIYDPTTGNLKSNSINNTVKGVDFTGYNWASVEEVGAMFNHITGLSLSSSNTLVNEVNSLWAPKFFQAGFIPTDTGRKRELWGETRTAFNPSNIFAPELSDWIFPDIEGLDIINMVNTETPFMSFPTMGQWVYTSTVPLPAGIWFLGTGLITLISVGRSKNRK